MFTVTLSSLPVAGSRGSSISRHALRSTWRSSWSTIPICSAIADEAVGPDRPLGRAVPAGQRLDRRRLTGAEADDRLEHDRRSGADQRPAQLTFELGAHDDPLLHLAGTG